MIKSILALMMIILLAASCSDKILNDNADKEILDKVYSSYKFPDGFYTENIDSANIYYINTVSINSSNGGGASWMQLSTNNRDTAFYWSELSCLNSSYYRKFVSETETEKYFEFRRVYEDNPKDVILFRVHKTNYLDRSMYDIFDSGNIVGRYNARPFELEKVKELIEYLVFVNNYNNRGCKVLESTCTENAEEFICSITEILTSRGDWGVRDRINVWENQYFINKTSGSIKLEKELVKTILGRKN